MTSRQTPRLVYDGDCGFCRRWILRWRRATGARVEYATSQAVGAEHPEVPPEAFRESVFLFEPDGRVRRGAEAVLASLARAGGWRRLPFWLYRRLPGFRPATEALYRCVAARRSAFSRADRLLFGSGEPYPGFLFSRRLFLGLLGAIAAVAFLSLWVQIEGLAGSRGIQPAAEWLGAVEGRLGVIWTKVPTLLWLGSADWVLHALCGGGLLLSLLVIFDLAPALCLAGIWVAYLSLVHAGGVFLSFQWDSLLLETVFLAAWLAPWRLGRGRGADPQPHPLARWLCWWLVFRLMFESGVVKLSAGDAAWHELTALRFHYETQPIPHALSWFAHNWPGWLHTVSGVVMFAIELGAPFLILAPRRLRHAGAWALIALQVVILFTGNYGFFNLLAIALCVLLLDDGALAFLRRRSAAVGVAASEAVVDPVSGLPPLRPRRREVWLKRWLLPPVALVVLFVSLFQVHDSIWPEARRSADGSAVGGFARKLDRQFGPFLSLNSYGLFRVMTTQRPEIVVEGSADGETWKAYGFRWKPGDPARPPRWCTPHMPRLDWQMWFAALGGYRASPWFHAFLLRLLENEPAVTRLLAHNPFPDAPPRFVRARLYDYRFTDPAERAETRAWWRREFLGPYAPRLTLSGR